jgi:hypothetical protein
MMRNGRSRRCLRVSWISSIGFGELVFILLNPSSSWFYLKSRNGSMEIVA